MKNEKASKNKSNLFQKKSKNIFIKHTHKHKVSSHRADTNQPRPC